jgi:hypothetical protein
MRPVTKCGHCGESTVAVANGYLCPECGWIYQPRTTRSNEVAEGWTKEPGSGQAVCSIVLSAEEAPFWRLTVTHYSPHRVTFAETSILVEEKQFLDVCDWFVTKMAAGD